MLTTASRKEYGRAAAADATALTVKNHGLVLLFRWTPVRVSPKDVPPLPSVKVELLVDEGLQSPRVPQGVRPLQSLR